jgi:hypothetical protein
LHPHTGNGSLSLSTGVLAFGFHNYQGMVRGWGF